MIRDRGRRIDVLLLQYNIFWQAVKIAYIGQVLPYYIWQDKCPIFRSGLIPPTSSYNLAFGSQEYVDIHPCWPQTKTVE